MIPDLEIIPHIFCYWRLAAYQLSSLILFPPKCRVLYRPCVTREGPEATEYLDFFAPRMPSTVTIEPLWMERRRLMRRAIGRNEAFKSSKAPILWAADADYLCGPGDMELILEKFPAGANLAHPGRVHATSHERGMQFIEAVIEPRIVEFDLTKDFPLIRWACGIGGLQFVRGDYARQHGYCGDEMGRRRMGPADRWQPTREDRKFRLKVGHDLGMGIVALYRVRHPIRSEGAAEDVRL